MQASRLTTIKVIGTIVALFCAYNAHAKLQSLEDGNLEKIAGAEGIGIILDDIQVQAENNATLNVTFDSGDTLFLYGNKFKIFKYVPKADAGGDFTAAPDKISAGSGFTIGSAADPIKLDIMSVNDLAGSKTYYNTANKEVGTGTDASGVDKVDIRFLRLALPVAGTLRSDAGADTRTAMLKDQAKDATLPTAIDKTTYAYGDKMQWTTVPFNCSGSAPKCLSLAIRLRADIYKTAYAEANPSKLQERLILWARADGVNLNGTYFDIWADSETGMSLSANASIYINELQFTTHTNTLDHPQYKSSDMELTNAAKQAGENKATLRLTLPYADNDTAQFKEGGKDTGLKFSGVYADLHLGNKFYQPLMLRSVLTPVERPAYDDKFKKVKPDNVRSDLSLELPAISKATATHFYKDEQNKSNIHVREVKMGAGENGKGYADYNVNRNGYNFGALTVEGLRIQQLKFTTRELKQLQRNHCPTNWSCSFR